MQATVERVLEQGVPENVELLRWMFKVCRNLWIDDRRARQVRQRAHRATGAQRGADRQRRSRRARRADAARGRARARALARGATRRARARRRRGLVVPRSRGSARDTDRHRHEPARARSRCARRAIRARRNGKSQMSEPTIHRRRVVIGSARRRVSRRRSGAIRATARARAGVARAVRSARACQRERAQCLRERRRRATAEAAARSARHGHRCGGQRRAAGCAPTASAALFRAADGIGREHCARDRRSARTGARPRPAKH